MVNFWGYRIDTSNTDFFYKELRSENRLRQGWGYHEDQDLRDMKMDGGAKRNVKIKNNVKKGDYILIPGIPSFGEVAIARATEDWDVGYSFSIPEGFKDYGHISRQNM